MLKKLTLLGMSVAALLALAAPAAQATGPLVTNGAGVASTNITATSSNTITHTSAGTLECTTVDLKLTTTHNSETTITVHGTGTAEGTPTAVNPEEKHKGHCRVSSGAIAEITHVNVTSIQLTKHGAEITGTAGFSFTYDLRSATGAGLIAECTFGGTVPVKRTEGNNVNVNGEIVKTGGGAFCPAAGTITGDFALTDEGTGLPVVFD